MKLRFAGLAPELSGAMLLLLLASGAHAGLFSDDEARQSISDLRSQQDTLSKQAQTLDERITRMESALQSYPDTVSRLETMGQDLAQLRGKVDSLANQIDAVDKRSHALYLDLDTRLKALETAAAPPKDAAATDDGGAGAKGDAGKDTKADAADDAASAQYDKALAAFNDGNYAHSLKQFQAFLKAHPKDSKAVNALYWVGMNQLSLKDFKAARLSNEKLFKEHPDSSKAPDALLNLASAWTGLGDAGNAKATLKLLISKYPDSSAAGKAKARLKQH
ncbi:MAG: tol-pal system protein YbgF [Betaproteobacteria bacterium]|nr:tol-pal system protein YbgF [Betaproteobacteria bacterium]